MKKNILVIMAGGTITQVQDEYGRTKESDDISFQDAIDKIKNQLNERASVMKYAETYEIEKIKTNNLLNKDSSYITADDWVKLIETIETEYDNYDAFVITHGTNTLAYTSAALSFALVNLGKPVILTGAMVPYMHTGSDAYMNLENSIRIATYSKKLILGVMVVFGSMIITGTRAKKVSNNDYDAFRAYNIVKTIGQIGHTVYFNKEPYEKHMDIFSARAESRADLVVKKDFNTNIVSLTEFPGMKSSLIESFANSENPVEGVILRSYGDGDPNVYNNLKKGFEILREKKIPIVVTSQTINSVATMKINKPGSLARELGAIPAMDMSIEAMTVKLQWLLGNKYNYEQIKLDMTQSIRGEISSNLD